MNHLVILHKPYLDLILTGAKTVESRLSRRRHPAATRCHPGDVLYLKDAGGDVRGRAVVAGLTEYNDIPPGGVAELAREWSARVSGGGPDDPYWVAKRDARHALFIALTDVRPCHIPAAAFPRRLPLASGWITGQPKSDVIERLETRGAPRQATRPPRPRRASAPRFDGSTRHDRRGRADDACPAANTRARVMLLKRAAGPLQPAEAPAHGRRHTSRSRVGC